MLFKRKLVTLLWTVSLLCKCQSEDSFLWKKLVDVSNENFVKSFLPSNYIDFENSLLNATWISRPCRQKIRSAFDGLLARRTWAVKLFNSWAKFPPTGTLSGTLTDYGDYDQCLSVVNDDPVSHRGVTQYCLVDISFPLPSMPTFHNYYQPSKVLPDPLETISNQTSPFLLNGTVYQNLADVASVFYYAYIQIGICLPAECNKNDVSNITNKVAHQLGLGVNKFHCETNPDEEWHFSATQLSAIALVMIIGALTLTAAIYDRVVRNKTALLQEQILLWFSPARNIRKLVCTRSVDDLTCVHGLRFLTINWIIIAHTLEWNNLNIMRDTFTIPAKLSELAMQPLYKAHYSVDTFFYLSGLLTSYVTLKYTNGDYRNFKVASFFLLRYLRLTPQLFVFILLTSLLPPMFDGPLWNSYMSKLIDRCPNTWWHNIVYLQNLIDIENICAVHTWFLAADMQLHWLSIFPLVLLLKNRTKGIVFTKMLILCCVCVSSITIFMQKLPPGSIITSKNNFLDEHGKPSPYISFFYKSWNHANVFWIGFIFGAFIYSTNLKNAILERKTKYLLWLLAFSGYAFCIYSTLPWLFGRPYEPIWSAILFPLNRTIWALVLTLVVWLCLTNNGTIIGKFLSWTALRPLSRMTYSVYLTHAWVLWIALGTRRELIDPSSRSILLLSSGVITASFVIGFFFTILFETPLIHFLEYIKRTWLDKEIIPMTKLTDREKEMTLLAFKAAQLDSQL